MYAVVCILRTTAFPKRQFDSDYVRPGRYGEHEELSDAYAFDLFDGLGSALPNRIEFQSSTDQSVNMKLVIELSFIFD